jgi:hypothetical protein
MLGDGPEAKAGADNLKHREGSPDAARRMSRRFPAPWSIEEGSPCFIVRDHDKQALAYVYFEDEAGRRSSAKLLTRDEAFLIAVNIAQLPSVPRQILKDIPRPPNSASRDD